MTVLSRWRAARLLVLFSLASALLACSPGTRVKVLGFFFDGVPGAPNARPTPAELARRQAAFNPANPSATPRPTPLPVVSTHRPVAERRCGECHQREGRFVPVDVGDHVCDKCHKERREREKWDHGPINLGACVPCHRAHDSPYPHLLDQPEPELCLQCHKDDMQRPVKEHQGAGAKKSCTLCHDPHHKEPRRITEPPRTADAAPAPAVAKQG